MAALIPTMLVLNAILRPTSSNGTLSSMLSTLKSRRPIRIPVKVPRTPSVARIFGVMGTKREPARVDDRPGTHATKSAAANHPVIILAKRRATGSLTVAS